MAGVKTPAEFDELVKAARLSPGSTQGAGISAPDQPQAASRPLPTSAPAVHTPHPLEAMLMRPSLFGRVRPLPQLASRVPGRVVIVGHRSVAGQAEAILANGRYDVLLVPSEVEAFEVVRRDQVRLLVVVWTVDGATPARLARLKESCSAIPILVVCSADALAEAQAMLRNPPQADFAVLGANETFRDAVDRLLLSLHVDGSTPGPPQVV